MVAINSAIEIDLTGQVCADSIGTLQYSGIGGQMDFMSGAALSEDGKPNIAITQEQKRSFKDCSFPETGSRSGNYKRTYSLCSYRIRNRLSVWKNLRQRAQELISIAHPDDREMLERAALKGLNTDNQISIF
jgi:acyl-CoA hydrolase